MMRVSQLFLTVTAVLLLGCSYAERHKAATSGDEIIVKFAADQAINATIVRAFDDPDATALLEDSVQTLSAELGVPLVYSRLTSGREIIVEIPTGLTVEAIAERIRKSDEVEHADITERTSGDVSNGIDEILVTFDDKDVELGPSVDLHALASRLVADSRFPVNCSIRADGRLAVTPDYEHLAGALAQALASRPDIDYAQPNYRVRHYDKAQ